MADRWWCTWCGARHDPDEGTLLDERARYALGRCDGATRALLRDHDKAGKLSRQSGKHAAKRKPAMRDEVKEGAEGRLMDTRTGEIRQLQEGEHPTEFEVALTPQEAQEAARLPPAERPAWWLERVKGKDRAAAHRGQKGKAKRRRRARR